MKRVSQALYRIDATFDDPNLVANAGLLAAGATGSVLVMIDIDSTICQVDGNLKHGAGFGHTYVLG